jgi:hypothetical protein
MEYTDLLGIVAAYCSLPKQRRSSKEQLNRIIVDMTSNYLAQEAEEWC